MWAMATCLVSNYSRKSARNMPDRVLYRTAGPVDLGRAFRLPQRKYVRIPSAPSTLNGVTERQPSLREGMVGLILGTFHRVSSPGRVSSRIPRRGETSPEPGQLSRSTDRR